MLPTTLRWKLIFIAVLAAVAAYIAWPSGDKPGFRGGEWFANLRVKLGLDLQGGAELRLGLEYPGKRPSPSEVRADLQKTIQTINLRINKYGLKEPILAPYGTDQILLQLPGSEAQEVQRIKEIVTRLGKLEFKLCASPEIEQEWLKRHPNAPSGYRWYPGPRKELKLVREKAEMTGRNIREAQPGFGGSSGLAEIVVNFELDAEGASLFEKLTSENVGQSLAIILDDDLRSYPTIREPIRETGQIEGSFDWPQAEDLGIVLSSGKLPAKLEVLSQLLVGPTLGKDSIDRGTRAIGVSLVAVLLFMLVYYMGGGIIACLALILNLIFLVAILGLFEATLTLPGIAGLVLTLGMAVDCNIITLERIREEKTMGKPVDQAFQMGYGRSFWAIFDANITTLIAGVILYYYGTGPIRGFAVTLSVGILTTLFTGVWCSRLLTEAAVTTGWIKEFRMLRILEKPSFGFMKLGAAATVSSLVVIAAGMFVFFWRGEENYGIEFRGGTAIQLELKEPVGIDLLRDRIRGIVVTGQDGSTRPKYPDSKVQSVWTEGEERAAGMSRRFTVQTLGASSKPLEADPVREQPAPSGSETSGKPAELRPEDELKKDLHEALREYLPDPPFEELGKFENPALPEYHKGTIYRISLEKPVGVDLAKQKMRKVFQGEGFTDPIITSEDEKEGQARQYQVVVASSDAAKFGKAEEAIRENKELPLSPEPFPSVEAIGKLVVADLKEKATWALILSTAAMLVYIGLRFDFVFGIAAVVALLHDALVTVGMTSLANALFPETWGIPLEMELSTIAALLTIIGYSVNDTIVTFDRVRENRRQMKKDPWGVVLDLSVNQTLSRTILTSLTAFLSVSCLFFLTIGSGSGISAFCFPMMVGMVAGTYSTVFIAAYFVYWRRRGATPAGAPPG